MEEVYCHIFMDRSVTDIYFRNVSIKINCRKVLTSGREGIFGSHCLVNCR